MASKPENTFIAGVHKHMLQSGLYHLKINMPLVGGIPDCWYSGKRADLWVEYKYVPALPIREHTKVHVNLSELQTLWLGRRYYEGRNVAVVLGHSKGGVLLEKLEWGKSFTTTEILERTMTRKELAEYIIRFTDGPVKQ